MFRAFLRAGLLVLIAAAAGCSPRLVPVAGKVLLDGRPLEGATIMFVPEDNPMQEDASGAVLQDGVFRLRTGNNIGAFPGKYKVTVLKIKMKATKSKSGLIKTSPKNLLPEKYLKPDETPIHVEVPPGGTSDLEIKLESKADQMVPSGS